MQGFANLNALELRKVARHDSRYHKLKKSPVTGSQTCTREEAGVHVVRLCYLQMHATGKPQNMQECCYYKFIQWLCLYHDAYRKTCNVSSLFKQVLRLFWQIWAFKHKLNLWRFIIINVSTVNDMLVFSPQKAYLKNLRYLGWF